MRSVAHAWRVGGLPYSGRPCPVRCPCSARTSPLAPIVRRHQRRQPRVSSGCSTAAARPGALSWARVREPAAERARSAAASPCVRSRADAGSGMPPREGCPSAKPLESLMARLTRLSPVRLSRRPVGCAAVASAGQAREPAGCARGDAGKWVHGSPGAGSQAVSPRGRQLGRAAWHASRRAARGAA